MEGCTLPVNLDHRTPRTHNNDKLQIPACSSLTIHAHWLLSSLAPAMHLDSESSEPG